MAYLKSLHKSLKVLVTLITLVAALLNQIHLGLQPTREVYPKQEGSIRVMSFNVLYDGKNERAMKNRRGIAVEKILQIDPDILGVQEATHEWMKWFNSKLKDYKHVGVGRDDGDIEGEFAAIFYHKDKYKLLDSGTFWISETPDIPSRSWASACNRICTWAVFEDLKTGQKFAHLNTHLDHVSNQARQKGVEMILDKAAEYGGLPVIVTGDFNFRENSALYKTITADLLEDTKFAAPDTMHHATFHNFMPAGMQGDTILDYIFVSKNIRSLLYRVETQGVDGRAVSDHYPIYADLIPNPPLD